MKEYKRLHAEWYELMSAGIDHSREIDFWAKHIDASGEPALELGSGTGRVLVPLLERGYKVVGIDTSPDMTARCSAACKAKGLQPEVHDQSMLDFHLPCQFGLIFLDSGGLGLFTSDQEIHALFERVMAHLKPGGRFIYEIEHVREKKESDSNWSGHWLRAPDDTIIAWRRNTTYDPKTHIWETLFIVDKFVAGQLLETEANDRTGRHFTVEEAVRYAERAGFEDIRAADWLTENPPNEDSKVITIQCQKPS